MKKKILILSFTDATRDPRVFRQLLTLNGEYELTVIGFGDPGMDGVTFFPVVLHPSTSIAERSYRAAALLLGKYEPYLHGRYRVLEKKAWETRYDCVIVNDLEPLLLGFALSKGAPVIFDAHEYYPEENTSSFFWRFFFQRPSYNLCRIMLTSCSAMTTVSEGVAHKYHREFGIRSTLVLNAPPYHEIEVRQCNPSHIRLIHHGGATPGRKLEKTIELLSYLDERFSLDMLLVESDRGYLNKLKKIGKNFSRLRFLPPVAMRDIVTTISTYDIGVFLLENNTYNHEYALANKVFEFIQARLCLAVSPTRGMKPFVEQQNIGVVSGNFSTESMAKALNALTTEDIIRFKQNSSIAAKKFNAEASMNTIRQIVKDALGEG